MSSLHSQDSDRPDRPSRSKQRPSPANRSLGERPRPLHPRDRKSIEEKKGVSVPAPQTDNKRFAVPPGTTAEKGEWLKKTWVELGLPRETLTLPRSLPDPLDGGYGESYTTAQEHYGEYTLKALDKQKKVDKELALSPAHILLLKQLQTQLGKPHLPALRHALAALHLRSSGEKHHIILQCHKASAPIIGAAKKFSSWAVRELPSVEAVHLLFIDTFKPVALGNVAHQAKLRTLDGPTRLSIPFASWPQPLELHPLEGARPHRPLWAKMVQETAEILQLRSEETLLDLCSGSGVFALEGARRGVKVVALDRKNGVGDMLHINAGQLRIEEPGFVRGELNSQTVKTVLEQLPPQTKVILDIPGMAIPAGIPTQFSKAEVSRVARIYSTPRQLESEMGRWKHNGYLLHKVRSYDMHPGGPGLELVAIFRRVSNDFITKMRKEARQTSPKDAEQRGSNHTTAPTHRSQQERQSDLPPSTLRSQNKKTGRKREG